MRSASLSRLQAVLLATALCASGPAAAQGFFESLFGGGASQPQPAPAARQSLPQPVQPAFGYRTPYYNPYRSNGHRESDGEAMPQSRSGTYRTMCVRLCDGFYWPISHNVSRASFYRDANACRSSCGVEARLFYHAANEGDAGQMVDQQGRAYSKLATAFKFRKAQVDGCRCKPEPWADSEINRHRLYALNETAEEKQRRATRFAHVMTPTGPTLELDGTVVLAAAGIGHGAARAVATCDFGVDMPVAVATAEPETPRGRKGRGERAAPVLPPREQIQRASLTRPTAAQRGPVQHAPTPQPKGFFGGAFAGGGGSSRWPGDR